jgi:hypothetical protein
MPSVMYHERFAAIDVSKMVTCFSVLTATIIIDVVFCFGLGKVSVLGGDAKRPI